MIFLQWVAPIREMLPISLGIDPGQGIGRGLLHNTNYAAQPLVLVGCWLLLRKSSLGRGHEHWHFLWILPALALTHSRFSIGITALFLAMAATSSLAQQPLRSLRAAPQGMILLLAVVWAGRQHPLGSILPLLGAGLVLLARRREPLGLPSSLRGIGSMKPVGVVVGLVLALLLALPGVRTQSRKVQAGGTAANSSAQRVSYLKVTVNALLDQPLIGHGLGATRPIFPKYVDRDEPALKSAYGDFVRPNVLHSEPLQCLLEGGLLLAVWVGLGLWLERRGGAASWGERTPLLLPLLLMCLMDFPLRNPLGMAWLGILVGTSGCDRPPHKIELGVFALLGALLAFLGWQQVVVAQRRPSVEAAFGQVRDPGSTLIASRMLWQRFPVDPELFDLYSKSVVQASASPGQGAGIVGELDQLLAQDPHDHHLLLARAQLARRQGDEPWAKACLEHYAEVAPRDPARYLRLATDALKMGNRQGALLLLQEAERQPGFGTSEALRVEQLRKFAMAP